MRPPYELRRTACAITVAAAALALLVPAAPARAAERIVAVPQSRYATTNVAIDQGEPLTFLNLDALSHDVTARDKGADGGPLFSTPLIGTGREVPVAGAESLGPGSYGFYCTVHPNMEGTLTVGGGQGGGGGGGDTVLSIRILDSKLAKVRREGALSVEVTHDRSVNVALSATTKSGGERVPLGKAKEEYEGSGSHPVEIPFSKAGRKALRGENRAKVAVTARGKDGEKTTARARQTLR
jgi:plastocyanin